MEGQLLNTWAGQEMSGAILPDQRQRVNLTKMCLRLHESPSLSFSAACGTATRKSASRLFSEEEVELQHGHIQKTVQRCESNELILIAEDTTDLNYDNHKQTQGLGRLGGKGDVLGLAIHSALALTPEGEPLGLIGQHVWAPISTNYRTGNYLQKLPIEEKESYKWIRTLQWSNERLKDFKGDVLIIGDREGDFYEHFIAPRNPGIDLLVRALHLRRKVLYKAEKMPVHDAAKRLDQVGQISINISRSKDQEERQATLAIHMGQVTCPPSTGRKGEPVELSLVWVHELDAPATVKEPVEWYLLTTCMIDELEHAKQLIKFYTLRWTIERFHYVLKQGMKVERLQFDTFTRLANALKLCSVVAWYMLRMSYLVKVRPEEPAQAHFDKTDIDVLEKMNKKTVVTVKDFALSLGKLVGFSPSKKQPFPGEKLFWQATQILFNVKTGFLLNQNYGTG